MDNSNEVPRHTSGLMSMISRRASNAANALRGGDGAFEVDAQGNAVHHTHPTNTNGGNAQQRRRSELQAGPPGAAAWPNAARDGQGPASAIAAASGSPVLSTTGALTNMLRRRRSGDVGTVANGVTGSAGAAAGSHSHRRLAMVHTQSSMALSLVNSSNGGLGSGAIKIRLVPHLESSRTLRFEPISRELKPGDPPLRIGRFTDRHNTAANANRLAFKSKVVSRGHAEVWLDSGKFYIKDTKSSSGTFLNHQRLAPPSQESKAHALKDGDILQLGVDFQGGHEDIYKCVKIRVEIGREWQKGVNAFNSQAMKTLRALSGTEANKKGGKKVKSGGDCCICLFGLQICQSIFIAPCSHSFHYKCIRPLLEAHHPGFTCPLCRTFADLTEDVEIEDDGEDMEEDVELERVAEEPAQFTPGNGFAGATLNGREGGLAAIASSSVSNVDALGLVNNTTAGPNTAIGPSRNPFRDSTGSVMQAARVDGGADSDAEMYNRGESVDRRGDMTDAEFAMPSRHRQETGQTVSDHHGPQEGHFEDHERDPDAMDVEQEAELQALRDGGRDMDEVQEETREHSLEMSRGRNSEEIVAGVIGGGSQTQLPDESNWDRTFIPDDGARVEESPRSSQEGSNTSSRGPATAAAEPAPGANVLPRVNTSAASSGAIDAPTSANSHSQSQPNLVPQSPQSPSIRGRLIRVPSLSSPYLSSNGQTTNTSLTRQQKRRSISRFGGALSENEGGMGGFFGNLLGRKRGTSVSANGGSPNVVQGVAQGSPESIDEVVAGVGSAEVQQAGEKRKR